MSDAGFILNATNELYRIFDALNENYFDGKLQDHHFTDEELHSGLNNLNTPKI